EQRVPERLGLRLLARHAGPLLREGDGVVTDFVPGNGHQASSKRSSPHGHLILGSSGPSVCLVGKAIVNVVAKKTSPTPPRVGKSKKNVRKALSTEWLQNLRD